MRIFNLNHIYISTKNTNIEEKNLGYFSSKNILDEKIKYFCTLKGFCNYPNGFLVQIIDIEDTPYVNYIYEVILYIHDELYNYEYTNDLGIFLSPEKAENSLKLFKEVNSEFLSSMQLNTEFIIDKYEIDKCEWNEGFEIIDF